jgi:biopolymer transport protein ExbB
VLRARSLGKHWSLAVTTCLVGQAWCLPGAVRNDRPHHEADGRELASRVSGLGQIGRISKGMWDQNLQEMFDRGGPVMWPLLAASILGVALILDRAIVFAWWYQGFDRVVTTLRPLILEGAWAKAEQWCRRRGPFTHLALIYLQQRNQSKEIRADVLRREGLLVLSHLEKRLRWLAALAQISTLLGLLGTFYFMIYRFHPGATAGGHLQQAEFFTAIWESFLSTMFGLVIAIPCTAAYQLFEGRTDAVARDLGILVSYLDEWSRTAEDERLRATSAVHGNGKLTKANPTVVA